MVAVPIPSPHSHILWGKEAGLTLISQTIEVYSKTAEEMLAFNEIPVMKRNFKTEDEKNKFILKLQEESTKNTSVQRQWVYFVFRKE